MSFDRASDVVVLNTWSEGDITLTERRGTTAAGTRRKARYAIDIKSEPLLMDLNELDLGQVVAETWAQRIRDNISGIAVRASDATIAMRLKAANALVKGEAWALKRYGGGRMGTFRPNMSDKLFNDSGRLEAGVFVRQNLTDASYTVNFPANRMNPSLFGKGYEAMVAKFVELVPMLDPKKALGDPQIEKAIKQGVADMIGKAEERSAAAIARKLTQLRAARVRVLKQVVGIARGAVGL